LGGGDLTLFIQETIKMKIVFSKEFLESFTGTQEELDDLTKQIVEAIKQGNYTSISAEESNSTFPNTLH
jgi:predicted DNA-binding protein